MDEPDRGSPLHLLLVGNGPYLNRGCEAIVRGTIRILEAAFGADLRLSAHSLFIEHGLREEQSANEPDARITHYALDARLGYPRTGLGVAIRRARNLLSPGRGADLSSLMKTAATAQAAFEVGGDNYSHRLPLLLQRVDRALGAARVPVFLWGATVGPFPGPKWVRQHVIRHLGRLPLILVRDTASQDYLASEGVATNVRLMGDPAFLLDPAAVLPDPVARVLTPGCLGLNVSPLWARAAVGCPEAAVDQVVRWLEDLTSALGRDVLLVPHVTIPWSNDIPMLEAVAARARPRRGCIVTRLPSGLDAATTKAAIARCAIFIGARMHATIASASSAVPTLFLGYSVKARALAVDLYGHTRYCAPTRALGSWDLVGACQELLSDAGGVASSLRERSSEMLRRALAAGPMVAPFLRVTQQR